jgi:hypothetical protein
MVKVERKISKHKYIAVALITLLIFSLGMVLGLLWDELRVNFVKDVNAMKDIDYQSLQFQYLYLSTLSKSETSCNALYVTLGQSVKDLAATLDALINYQKQSSINTKQYELIERDYILDNLRYWLFAKQVKEQCSRDVVTVLYFYKKYDCPVCNDQGFLLTHYKKIFEDRLLVFPIDSDLKSQEVAISLVESQYNVTQYPTMIIGDKKYYGLVEKEDLGRIICSSFRTRQKECETIS